MKLQNYFSNERTRRKWKLGIIGSGAQLDTTVIFLPLLPTGGE